jgi:hypothetical protein
MMMKCCSKPVLRDVVSQNGSKKNPRNHFLSIFVKGTKGMQFYTEIERSLKSEGEEWLAEILAQLTATPIKINKI